MSSLQQDRLRSKIDACMQNLADIRTAQAEYQLTHPGEDYPNSVAELRSLDILRDLFRHWENGMSQRVSDASWVKVYREINSIDQVRREMNLGYGDALGAPSTYFERKRKQEEVGTTSFVCEYEALDADQQHDLALFQGQSSDDESYPAAQEGAPLFRLDPASLVSFVDAALFGI
jgi:hypothetical protein